MTPWLLALLAQMPPAEVARMDQIGYSQWLLATVILGAGASGLWVAKNIVTTAQAAGAALKEVSVILTRLESQIIGGQAAGREYADAVKSLLIAEIKRSAVEQSAGMTTQTQALALDLERQTQRTIDRVEAFARDARHSERGALAAVAAALLQHRMITEEQGKLLGDVGDKT